MTFIFKAQVSICNAFLLSFLIHIGLAGSARANTILEQIEAQEHLLGARIGVSIYDVKANDSWDYNGNTKFPLMSTFKVLACAKLLADVEKGLQSFDTATVITTDSLINWSPITKKLVGEKISLKEACSAAMIMSDNTATNIVFKGIDGPKALTQFMRAIGDEFTRLDRIEPELNEALDGDKRDTTTPNAMVKSLHTLLFGDVLSRDSKVQLKQWMIDNKVTGSLLRSVLPEHWFIADRSGSGGFGSRGITAVVWSDKRTPLIISIYLTQTDATFAQRNKAIADIGKAIFAVYRK
ncbi:MULTISPECIES: class A beta-lactamase [unclassified Colwellia]|uniref:class A beta-lactamase n=1 Tax=unclassified Colwellia TaxID=196834 RepID=UPI0015F71BB8|nr:MULTISPECIES: class A beta-lactamase [unclassified Colwellia]MBA6231684.1 class A beta-lactamase [Colwellia sp. MB02u-7]MBA6235548.1 class A beta-lactamase [Colwellia sp. MB02u-11]MBA6300272.1 class A beta-lactamase [Colwellia sp. MB3u-22]MBA6305352.1 class A beta-lactamase [Colwellia sp. MB02u-14]MBA6312517.1 class A beta-lactamase [Colwellia sp. MB3u-64]